MAAAKRALILGLDAMVPNTLERFLDEGLLPNLARLRERGVLTRVRPVIPAQTPTNWTTIATGATPGNHGIVQWGSHVPGEPVWEGHNKEAFSSGLCRAEYIWEAAAREGRSSVVMNYAGYPPTTDKAVSIDWLYSPTRSYFDLATPTLYHNCPELDTQDPIEVRPASDWSGVPDGKLPPLEVELPVATSTQGWGPTYVGLLIARGEGYDTLLIAEANDASDPVATLGVGQWSEWVRAPFETVEHGEVEGAFRFKLVELAPDGSRVRLYRSDAFATDGGFCSDAALGERLIAELGPYVHSGMTCHMQCHGVLDWDTFDEVMAAEAEWWSGAAAMAMKDRDASVLVLHWHDLDAMGHSYVRRVDPTGTDYDAENAESNWEIIRSYYRAADRFVGAFMDKLDDGETVFSVVSDHGMPANKSAVSLVNLFKDRGWVTVSDDGESVDWKQSKVYFAQNHLWINLEGRDEGGIVPPDEYDALRAEVLSAMRDVKDPDTDEHAFAFVLPREDAPMVGLWGDYVGDLAYCYSGGFRWSGAEVLRMGEERIVFPCSGGNHGPMIPTYETETTSVMGAWVLAGPGVRAGTALPRLEQARICTTDVAPTVAHLVGMAAPAQCEGRIVHEFVAGMHAERPARTLEPMARPLVGRPSVKPQPPKLQGDVTDEV